MKRILIAALVVGATATLSFVSPASAQATRTWVSGVGDDANPCSRTAPCKTFAGAYPKTAAGGEINCIDAGGFGGITISKSLTIRCLNTEAGVLVAGTNAIVVTAGGADTITLEGLDFAGVSGALDGVRVLSGLQVNIIRCRISGFTGNGGHGVNVISTTNNTRVVIENSIINNNDAGVNVAGQSGAANSAAVLHSLVDSNKNFGLQAEGPTSSVVYAWATIANNPLGLSQLNGGQIFSFGPSSVVGGTGSPNQTLPFR